MARASADCCWLSRARGSAQVVVILTFGNSGGVGVIHHGRTSPGRTSRRAERTKIDRRDSAAR
eukprot:CAMPEP_0179915144 /NCGR_PEP_ID=MMETSP0983-20121128/1501_1 /TAXON_ID=483367 /ORGANISM="non described non described, Strain CCMP 2436" /LENGTH=62 /DNA_ID=CAMNT_0021817509 /DNA_START=333 /DNA_END=517 /DNA_ORIENTATION=+